MMIGMWLWSSVRPRKFSAASACPLSVTFPAVLPAGITIEVPKEKNTSVTISGIDKELVGNTAAKIREVRPPEVYKGKGIRYEGEVVRRKAGKSGKK